MSWLDKSREASCTKWQGQASLSLCCTEFFCDWNKSNTGNLKMKLCCRTHSRNDRFRIFSFRCITRCIKTPCCSKKVYRKHLHHNTGNRLFSNCVGQKKLNAHFNKLYFKWSWSEVEETAKPFKAVIWSYVLTFTTHNSVSPKSLARCSSLVIYGDQGWPLLSGGVGVCGDMSVVHPTLVPVVQGGGGCVKEAKRNVCSFLTSTSISWYMLKHEHVCILDH